MSENLQYLKKSVKIEDILTYFGFDVPQTQKTEFFIHSPFREERTPSFKINTNKNTWYDFGEAVGGSNIDLLIKLKGWDTKEAVNFLKNFSSLSFPPQDKIFQNSPLKSSVTHENDRPAITILKEKKIENKALISYLKQRKIPLEIAKKYLSEIYFKNGEKRYFALAWHNENGGTNWRNKYMKGCIGSNSYTFFSKNSKNVTIFEGVFDFLSAVVYFGKEPESSDVIVLNSLANVKKIDFSKYETINLFLDNDEAGERTKNEFFGRLSKKVKDYSKIYTGYKDFNEFLTNI
jgi:hypothetical protein